MNSEAASGVTEDGFVILGRVGRPCGLGGAFLLLSGLEDPAALSAPGLELRDGLKRRPAEVLEARPAPPRGASPRSLIIKIQGVGSREAAAALKGFRLAVPRRSLPPLPEDEVYWADLAGLAVFTREGRALGRVEGLMEAGAGLLLAVVNPAEGGRERLLPFQPQFLAELDLAGGRIVLDPPAGLLDL